MTKSFAPRTSRVCVWQARNLLRRGVRVLGVRSEVLELFRLVDVGLLRVVHGADGKGVVKAGAAVDLRSVCGSGFEGFQIICCVRQLQVYQFMFWLLSFHNPTARAHPGTAVCRVAFRTRQEIGRMIVSTATN